MDERVTNEHVRMARQADLYAYLLQHHATEFIRQGNSLRWTRNRSISIRKGYSGFLDFATNEHGNGIDFLCDHLQYKFVHAVQCLIGDRQPETARTIHTEPTQNGEDESSTVEIENGTPDITPAGNPSDFTLPVQSRLYPSKAIQYLANRGIPENLTRNLIDTHLLYQSFPYNNLVFVSKNKDFCELRGTYPTSTFHQCKKQAHDRCWGYSPTPHRRHRSMPRNWYKSHYQWPTSPSWD